MFNSEGKRIEKITDNHTDLVLRIWFSHAKQC